MSLQSGDSANDTLTEYRQLPAFALLYIATIDRVQKVVLTFVQRGAGDVQEMREIGIRPAAKSL